MGRTSGGLAEGRRLVRVVVEVQELARAVCRPFRKLLVERVLHVIDEVGPFSKIIDIRY
jgi:hypothetical protein